MESPRASSILSSPTSTPQCSGEALGEALALAPWGHAAVLQSHARRGLSAWDLRAAEHAWALPYDPAQVGGGANDGAFACMHACMGCHGRGHLAHAISASQPRAPFNHSLALPFSPPASKSRV